MNAKWLEPTSKQQFKLLGLHSGRSGACWASLFAVWPSNSQRWTFTFAKTHTHTTNVFPLNRLQTPEFDGKKSSATLQRWTIPSGGELPKLNEPHYLFRLLGKQMNCLSSTYAGTAITLSGEIFFVGSNGCRTYSNLINVITFQISPGIVQRARRTAGSECAALGSAFIISILRTSSLPLKQSGSDPYLIRYTILRHFRLLRTGAVARTRLFALSSSCRARDRVIWSAIQPMQASLNQ